MDLLSRYHELCPDFKQVDKIRPALRINTLKITEQELVQRLQKKKVKLEKIPFANHGYWYDAPFSLGSTPEYLQGYYYLQDAASQISAELLNPQHGETVLDMACAPGGKLTQLAAMMHNKGLLVGIDSAEGRLISTRNNMARLGVLNAVLYCFDSREAAHLNMQFDKILLDAPCSGNYAVDKDFLHKRRVRDFENREALQKELIKTALNILKPGGTLVYSTCSLEPEEDEMVVHYAAKELNAKVEPIDLAIGDSGLTKIFGNKMHPSIAHCRRFWPHKTGTQGFFVAKMKK
jgi:NOL1/NOP2/sun family putative RNA methylase